MDVCIQDIAMTVNDSNTIIEVTIPIFLSWDFLKSTVFYLISSINLLKTTLASPTEDSAIDDMLLRS
jgi:hypothetical protein